MINPSNWIGVGLHYITILYIKWTSRSSSSGDSLFHGLKIAIGSIGFFIAIPIYISFQRLRIFHHHNRMIWSVYYFSSCDVAWLLWTCISVDKKEASGRMQTCLSTSDISRFSPLAEQLGMSIYRPLCKWSRTGSF